MVTYLILNGILYFIVGAWCALRPHETAQSIGFELTNLQGVAEFTAVYGGLELGLALFFLVCGIAEQHRPTGILMALCLYGGLVGLRSYSLLKHGSGIENGWYFFALEGALLIWAMYLYARS